MSSIEDIRTIKQIGSISKKVVDLLKLPFISGTEILIGPNNVEHMRNRHEKDFEKYSSEMINILANPDYVIPHPKDESLQYIKVIDRYVLVVVRVSRGGKLFARSIYTMTTEKIDKFQRKGLFDKFCLTK